MSVVTTVSLTRDQTDWLDKNIKNKSELFRELINGYIGRYSNPEELLKRKREEYKEIEEKLRIIGSEIFDLEQIIKEKNINIIRKEVIRLTEFEGLRDPIDIELAAIKSLGPKFLFNDIRSVIEEITVLGECK